MTFSFGEGLAAITTTFSLRRVVMRFALNCVIMKSQSSEVENWMWRSIWLSVDSWIFSSLVCEPSGYFWLEGLFFFFFLRKSEFPRLNVLKIWGLLCDAGHLARFIRVGYVLEGGWFGTVLDIFRKIGRTVTCYYGSKCNQRTLNNGAPKK